MFVPIDQLNVSFGCLNDSVSLVMSWQNRLSLALCPDEQSHLAF